MARLLKRNSKLNNEFESSKLNKIIIEIEKNIKRLESYFKLYLLKDKNKIIKLINFNSTNNSDSKEPSIDDSKELSIDDSKEQYIDDNNKETLIDDDSKETLIDDNSKEPSIDDNSKELSIDDDNNDIKNMEYFYIQRIKEINKKHQDEILEFKNNEMNLLKLLNESIEKNKKLLKKLEIKENEIKILSKNYK